MQRSSNGNGKTLGLYIVALFSFFAAAIGFWRSTAPPARPAPSPAVLFVRAVEEGDVGRVRLLLDQGVVTANTARPLRGAQQRRGIPDKRDRYRATPVLEIAVRNRDISLTRLLLSRGANVNTSGRFGLTALMMASQNGDPVLTALLLQKGADPNAREKIFGETALHRVAFRRSRYPGANAEKVVRLLLAAGADPRIQDRRGLTPADAAARAGKAEIAELIRTAAPKLPAEPNVPRQRGE